MELNFDKLSDDDKEIVKKQVKSQYERLKFRKYASLSKFNFSSGSYKTKLRLLFDKEIENERLFYIYVYNLLRPNTLITPSEIGANINDKMFEINLPLGQLADRLKDSIWMTKKRIVNVTQLVKGALELLEDQLLIQKPDNQQVLSESDKEQVKKTLISMINYVCETKKTLLDEALKEADEPMFNIADLNPFAKPLQIQIVKDDQKQEQQHQRGGEKRRTQQYITNVNKRHLRKTKRRRA